MYPMVNWKEHLGLCFVLTVTLILLLRYIGDSSLYYPDANRILMDGVFILDFLRTMPVGEIYEFTTDYYAQYPALSIGYRPPFFPFIEALFNGAFGINMWSSRLAIVAFTLVGVTAWHKLVKKTFGTDIAFWASLLMVTTPFIAKWGWYTMGELPVLSMALLTAYVFYCYTETERPGYLYATAILFSLTVWTKQTAVFLVPWFLLYLVVKGQILNCLKRKEFWISTTIILLMIIPLTLITIWLGDQNIEQSIGANENARNLAWRLKWWNLKILIITLTNNHLTLPVLILSLTGMVWAAWKRDPRCLYFVLLIISTYVFFSYLRGKDVRYPIFWIPAFSLFATMPLLYLRQSPLRIAVIIVLGITSIYQVTQVYAIVPYYATGYDEAAQYVIRESKGPTVLFNGRNDGKFTYFMRALDHNRSLIVLRGDKLLTSSSIFPNTLLKIHAQSTEDIENILNKYGTTHIVVESKDHTGIKIIQELLVFLNSGPFRLVKIYPVKSNFSGLEDQTLKVYEYLNSKPITATHLELRLPVVGQTLNIPIARLLSRIPHPER